MAISLDILIAITMVTAMMATISAKVCGDYQACAITIEGEVYPLCSCGGTQDCPVSHEDLEIADFMYICENVSEVRRCTSINEVAVEYVGYSEGTSDFRLRCRCRTYTWIDDETVCEELADY
uniref:Gsp_24 putative toxin n=1 Tax=Gemmula speciosa TaxID=439592 RepID=A0A098LXT7_GEMSP